jgi:hypothetical protein
MFKVGDRVRALMDLGDAASGDAPALLFAKRGEELIVRGILDDNYTYEYNVSHEDVTKSYFSVYGKEIELIENIPEMEK